MKLFATAFLCLCSFPLAAFECPARGVKAAVAESDAIVVVKALKARLTMDEIAFRLHPNIEILPSGSLNYNMLSSSARKKIHSEWLTSSAMIENAAFAVEKIPKSEVNILPPIIYVNYPEYDWIPYQEGVRYILFLDKEGDCFFQNPCKYVDFSIFPLTSIDFGFPLNGYNAGEVIDSVALEISRTGKGADGKK